MMTFYEFEKLMEEDEIELQKHPRCINCKHLLCDYGLYECNEDTPIKGLRDLEDWDIEKMVCKEWRSAVSGELCTEGDEIWTQYVEDTKDMW